MSFEDDLCEHLAMRYDARVVILYGSLATGDATAASDVDAVCFVEDERRFPEAYTYQGRLMDVWIHPVGDASNTNDFLKLHGCRVLLDKNGIGADLLQRVNAFLETAPEVISKESASHQRAWLWKMFDRALLGDAEGDHRRHWLLCDLPEAWCLLTARRYLGPKKTLQVMRARAPDTLRSLEHALRPNASPTEIEQAVLAIAGPRARTG